jgi:hypothetical protein
VRWIIGDTESGPANAKKVHIHLPGPMSSPISSSTPTDEPITWSCARPRRPTWPRCCESIPSTSSSRSAARMLLPRLRLR